MTDYVELQVLTHFSLLRGASSPEELFAAAVMLAYPALGRARRRLSSAPVNCCPAKFGGKPGVRPSRTLLEFTLFFSLLSGFQIETNASGAVRWKLAVGYLDLSNAYRPRRRQLGSP